MITDTARDDFVVGSGGGCFQAGTQIQLEGGKTKAINLLKEGDSVLSFDEWGAIHVSKVTKLHIHENPQPILRVDFWRGVINITPNHWVLNQYGSFVEVDTLTEHDAVVDGMGHLRPIISKRLLKSEPVYNLTVEPNHTFIADDIRVHNGGHRERYPAVTGSGGRDAKGGGGRVAVEDPDTLESKANIKIIDLIGEGLIGGLVNGAKSIFLNDTPLQNSNGTYNFSSVSWDHREGSPNQAIIPGFSSVESPHSMGPISVTTVAPQSFSITNPNTDRVRIIVNVPILMQQDTTTGDTHGTSVTYHFTLITNGGSPVGIGTSTISGKTKSKYQRSHVFTLPKPQATNTWTITMVRDTADSIVSSLANPTQLDSYVEIVDVKINYANSALVSVGVDPQVFSSIPSRAYLVDGLYIQVPSNRSYDAPTKTAIYTGVWNGGFVTAVCSNPAWILYDLLTTKRYGLGNYLSASQVDIAMLYTIGRYCDEMVADGMGGAGTEPRFAINTQIQTQAEAYKVISDISSAFRGMTYWNGGMLSFRQDSPQTPTMVFNQANIINGEFNYTSSSRKDRHSVVNVTWNDPTANYKQRIEYVEDHDQINAMGIKTVNTIAFGCTSRGQANRVGRWILYSEKYEANLITFKVGLDASLVLPGEVVRIADAFKAGKRAGGRATSSTTTTITADSAVTLSSGVASIFIAMPDGSFAQRPLLQATGSFTTLSWTTPLQIAPVDNAVFVLSDAVVPMLARVVSISQDGKDATEFTIVAVEHNETKYGAIESGMLLKAPQTSVAVPYVATIANIAFDETTYFIAPGVIGSKLHVYWEGKATSFQFSYRITTDGGIGNWITTTTKTPSFDIEGLAKTSVVHVKVSGLDFTDTWTIPITGTFTIAGKTALPAAPTGLTATGGYGTVMLNWINSSDVDLKGVNVYQSSSNNSAVATLVASVTGTTYTVSGIVGNNMLYFWVKSVNTSDSLSAFNTAVNAGTSVTPSTIDSSTWTKDGIDFSVGTTDQLTWTAGNVYKNGTLSGAVSAGSQTWTTAGTTLYVYYDPSIPLIGGLRSLQTTTVLSAAVAIGTYPLATYIGGPATNIKGGNGSVFISGSQVIAGTVGAAQLVAGQVITNSAQIKNAIITDAHITGLLTANKIDTRGITVKDNAGTTILSATNPLDYANVGGTTKPANNATRNVYRGTWVTAIAYIVGDTVTDSIGYGWSCMTAHTSGAAATGFTAPPGITTPVYPATNIYWALYAVKGMDSISIVLSNDTHVFPASSDGTVTDYSNSGTTIVAYEGSGLLTYDGVGTAIGTWRMTTAATNITIGAITSASNIVTVSVSSAVSSAIDSSAVVYTISGVRLNGIPFTITAQQSFAKSKSGVGYIVEIESTNGNEFRVGQGKTTLLIAHVFQGATDITAALSASQFRWRRVSIVNDQPPNDDATWDALYASGYKQISVSVDAVFSKATFFCDILSLI